MATKEPTALAHAPKAPDAPEGQEEPEGALDEVVLTHADPGLFKALPAATRAELERNVRELRLPAGTTIFEAGDPGDALYLVRSGLVDLTTGSAASRRIVTFGAGEAFGEQSLLTGRPRSATVVAQTGVTLWRLDHADFVAVLAKDPELGAAVARHLSEQLRTTTRTHFDLPRGKTVLLYATRATEAADLAAKLVPHATRMLREEPVVLACGPAAIWDAATLPTGALVLDPDAWAAAAVRAVRERSLVLLVCTGDPPAEVVTGADRAVIAGTGPRHAPRPADRPTRIVAAAPDDEEAASIAREVCGRRVGLALGSGGIRGWAHAGVLGVLVEEGIPIDLVSGASAGAVAGALFVAGMPTHAMLEIPTVARDVLWACLRSYRPTAQAILSSRPFITYLRDQLGKDPRIEDLPKPFVIATTDLDTREAVHLDRGPLPEAIVASAAVNGIFPPVTIDGRRLVDGGASDPVPVSALRERGADIVIAVNVMAVGKGASGFYTPRFRIPMPGLLDTLLIGLDTVITQAAAQCCALADVVVEPYAANASWRDLLPAAKYAAAGARAMRAAVPELRALLGEDVLAA